MSRIQYEQKFQAYDTQRIVPTKGIDPAAKSILQDEYVSKPRKISTVPRSLQRQQEDEEEEETNSIKTGKKLGPTQIPQVFIL